MKINMTVELLILSCYITHARIALSLSQLSQCGIKFPVLRQRERPERPEKTSLLAEVSHGERKMRGRRDLSPFSHFSLAVRDLC